MFLWDISVIIISVSQKADDILQDSCPALKYIERCEK